MRKQIKKWGNALIISFSAEEKAIYDIKEGDIIEMEVKFVEQGK